MTPEYIEKLEGENDTLRKEVSDLTSQVAILKSENTSLKSIVNKPDDKTIYVDGKIFNISSFNNMIPLIPDNEHVHTRRRVVICTTCLTVGINNEHNMVCKVNSNVCAVCQASISFVFTLARWMYIEKVKTIKVKKKGWFGKVREVDETFTEKIYRWYFFNEK